MKLSFIIGGLIYRSIWSVCLQCGSEPSVSIGPLRLLVKLWIPLPSLYPLGVVPIQCSLDEELFCWMSKLVVRYPHRLFMDLRQTWTPNSRSKSVPVYFTCTKREIDLNPIFTLNQPL
ncbi:hypothetical protein J6590_043567 [Homalodisca vitripennis]|nr:hypothetical protein J6590_043567 [Homalodisca vitripennis]